MRALLESLFPLLSRLSDYHIVEVEVTGPDGFTVKTARQNPAKLGAVTGNATYNSFWSSLLGMYSIRQTDGVNWCSALPKNTVCTEHPSPNLDLHRECRHKKAYFGTVHFAFYSAIIKKKSTVVHEYAVTYPSLIIYLNFCLSFFQSARVMEGGFICVDNSGLLQKVQMNRRKTHVAHDELIKQVSC